MGTLLHYTLEIPPLYLRFQNSYSFMFKIPPTIEEKELLSTGILLINGFEVILMSMSDVNKEERQ